MIICHVICRYLTAVQNKTLQQRVLCATDVTRITAGDYRCKYHPQPHTFILSHMTQIGPEPTLSAVVASSACSDAQRAALEQ